MLVQDGAEGQEVALPPMGTGLWPQTPALISRGTGWPVSCRLQGNRGHVTGCTWPCALPLPPLFPPMPPCPLVQLSGALTLPRTDASIAQAHSPMGPSRWHGAWCVRVTSCHLSHQMLGRHGDTQREASHCPSWAKSWGQGAGVPLSLPACGERGKQCAGCRLAAGPEVLVTLMLSALGWFLALVVGAAHPEHPASRQGHVEVQWAQP